MNTNQSNIKNNPIAHGNDVYSSQQSTQKENKNYQKSDIFGVEQFSSESVKRQNLQSRPTFNTHSNIFSEDPNIKMKLKKNDLPFFKKQDQTTGEMFGYYQEEPVKKNKINTFVPQYKERIQIKPTMQEIHTGEQEAFAMNLKNSEKNQNYNDQKMNLEKNFNNYAFNRRQQEFSSQIFSYDNDYQNQDQSQRSFSPHSQLDTRMRSHNYSDIFHQEIDKKNYQRNQKIQMEQDQQNYEFNDMERNQNMLIRDNQMENVNEVKENPQTFEFNIINMSANFDLKAFQDYCYKNQILIIEFNPNYNNITNQLKGNVRIKLYSRNFNEKEISHLLENIGLQNKFITSYNYSLNSKNVLKQKN